MLKTRIIPCLLLKGTGLVKTKKFKHPVYIGDPINVVKIFNEKEVDEIIFLDISASLEKRGPDFKLIESIASEAFIPFGYGGGIRYIKDMERLFRLGVEKVILNSSAFNNPTLVLEASKTFGSQSIVVSMDIKPNIWNRYEVWTLCGTHNTKKDPIEYAKKIQELGAGELFLNSIDRDGTMKGYDVPIIHSISSAIEIPVIASGGAGSLQDIREVLHDGGASAASAGSFFVFQGIHRAVLITYPGYEEIQKLF
jgi:cyclase